MRRLIPPILFLALLMPLGLIPSLHPEGGRIWTTTEAPWDVPLPLGLALLIWSWLHFRTKAAEIHTFGEPKTLVTDGPFRFSRNPMYLGFTLLLLAAALAANTWCALLAPLTFLIVSAFWYVPHEERTLRRVFGTAYDDYAWRTRRWI